MDFLGWETPPRISLTFSKFVVSRTGTALVINCFTYLSGHRLVVLGFTLPFCSEPNEITRDNGDNRRAKMCCGWHGGFCVQSYLELWTLLHSAHYRAKAGKAFSA